MKLKSLKILFAVLLGLQVSCANISQKSDDSSKLNSTLSAEQFGDIRESKIEYEVNHALATHQIVRNLGYLDAPRMPRPNPVRNDFLSQFQQFSSHHAVTVFENEKIWGDLMMGYLLHFEDFPSNKVLYDPSKAVKVAQSYIDVDIKDFERFHLALLDFYRDANVSEFLDKHRPYFQGAIDEIRRFAQREAVVGEMEHYTRQVNKRYVFIPEPLYLVSAIRGIGPAVETAQGKIAYQVISPSDKIDLSPTDINASSPYGYGDDEYLRWLSVHEFGHSFVNDAFDEELNARIDKHKDEIDPQVYKNITSTSINTLRILMIEHAVRLLEIRVAEIYGSKGQAARLREQNKNFIFLPEMEKIVIEQYEADPTRYGTYRDFIPDLMQVLENQ